MRRNPLWGALPLMAQMLGRKLGVKVEIGGDEAYTDGQTIHLPGLPLAGKPLEILANGFIDHEAAHVRYTDFTIPVPPGLAKLLTNLLEDIRIEPVSYTHLDVYKRQPFSFQACLALYDPRLEAEDVQCLVRRILRRSRG